MPKGASGRIVIEVDPSFKQRLYEALNVNSSTLKNWFIDAATEYVNEHGNRALLKATKSKLGDGQ